MSLGIIRVGVRPPTRSSFVPQPISMLHRHQISRFLGLAFLFLVIRPGLAQEEDEQTRIYRRMGLEPVAFNAESLGLRMHLPEGASIQTRPRAEQPVFIISDTPQPTFWRFQVESVRLQSPSDQWADAEAFLNQILTRQTDYQVLTRESPQFGDRDARLCYIQRALSSGNPVINGWLVIPNGRASLLVFTISSLPDFYPDLKPLLDQSFSTIQLVTEEQRNLEQRARIENGRDLLKSFTMERLRSLVGLSQWFRTYRPARPDISTRETEFACSLVEVYEAPRGALKQNYPIEKYTQVEQEKGLMVRVQGRVIIDAERGLVFDTLAMFWLSWDQSSEAWSILGTRRQGQASQTETETGIRTAPSVGNPRPSLTVIRSDPSPFTWDVPDVYLSQALAWLLGRLLPRDLTESTFYCYYYYNARTLTPNISLRYDRWEPLRDGTGNWQLATLLDKSLPPDVSIYAPDGSLVRRTRPTGEVTVPITREQLRRIWRSKGLRTEPSGK